MDDVQVMADGGWRRANALGRFAAFDVRVSLDVCAFHKPCASTSSRLTRNPAASFVSTIILLHPPNTAGEH